MPSQTSRRLLIRRAAGKLPVLKQILALKSEVQGLQAACGQLQDMIREMGGLMPPPPHLQKRVVGVYAPDFIKSGEDLIEDINAVLAHTGKNLNSFETILDFGSGCARVLRPLRRYITSAQKLYGTDIDAEAIQWCQENYSQVAEFSVNPAMPPTIYRDDKFDLIYSISVFTHLPEDMQFAWLQELHRIAKRGAYLVLSVHGENHYNKHDLAARRTMQDKGFNYRTYAKS
ncbi:MAG: class I SAM-dependent methyltransferase [Pyrinomonadaceae bacterium]